MSPTIQFGVQLNEQDLAEVGWMAINLKRRTTEIHAVTAANGRLREELATERKRVADLVKALEAREEADTRYRNQRMEEDQKVRANLEKMEKERESLKDQRNHLLAAITAASDQLPGIERDLTAAIVVADILSLKSKITKIDKTRQARLLSVLRKIEVEYAGLRGIIRAGQSCPRPQGLGVFGHGGSGVNIQPGPGIVALGGPHPNAAASIPVGRGS